MTQSTKDFITSKEQEIKWAEENGKPLLAKLFRDGIKQVIEHDKQQELITNKQLTLWI